MNLSLDLNTLYGNDSRRLIITMLSGIAIVAAGFLSRDGLMRLIELDHPLSIDSATSDEADGSEGLVDISAQLGAPSITSGTHPEHATRVSSASIRNVSRQLYFVSSEIARYKDIAASLRDHSETEADPARLARMNVISEHLDERLSETANAAAFLKNARLDGSVTSLSLPFLREHLRGSLLALQESGEQALSVIIDSENHRPGIRASSFYNLSRSGE